MDNKRYDIRHTYTLPGEVIGYLSSHHPQLLQSLLLRKVTLTEIQALPLEYHLPIALYLKNLSPAHVTVLQQLPTTIKQRLLQALHATFSDERLKQFLQMSKQWQALQKDTQVTPTTLARLEGLTSEELEQLLLGTVAVPLSMFPQHSLAQSPEEAFSEDNLDQLRAILPHLLGIVDQEQIAVVRTRLSQIHTLYAQQKIFKSALERIFGLDQGKLRGLLLGDIQAGDPEFDGLLTRSDMWFLLLLTRTEQEQERIQVTIERVEQQNPATWRRLWENFVETSDLCFASLLQQLLLGQIAPHRYPQLFWWEYRQQQEQPIGEDEMSAHALDDIWHFIISLAPEFTHEQLTTPQQIVEDLLITQEFSREQQTALEQLLQQPSAPDLAPYEYRLYQEQKMAWQQQLTDLASFATLPMETQIRLKALAEKRPEVVEQLCLGQIKVAVLPHYLHPQDLYPMLQLLLPKPVYSFQQSNPTASATFLQQVHEFGSAVDVFNDPCIGTGFYSIPIYKVDNGKNTLVVGQEMATRLGTELFAFHTHQQSFVVIGDQEQDYYSVATTYLQQMEREVTFVSFRNPGASLKLNPLAFIPPVDAEHCPPTELNQREFIQSLMADCIATTWTESAILQKKLFTLQAEERLLGEDIKAAVKACLLHVREAHLATPPPLFELVPLLRDATLFFQTLNESGSNYARRIAANMKAQSQQWCDTIFRAIRIGTELLEDRTVRRLCERNEIDFTYLLRYPTICLIDVPDEKQVYFKPLTDVLYQIIYRTIDETKRVSSRGKEQQLLPVVLITSEELYPGRKDTLSFNGEARITWHRNVIDETFLVLTPTLLGMDTDVLPQVEQIIAANITEADTTLLSKHLGGPVHIGAGEVAYNLGGKLLIGKSLTSFATLN